MKVLRVFAGLASGLALSGIVYAGTVPEGPMSKLMEGNKRYVSGAFANKDLGDEKRKELAKGQHPSAIIVTCSDSRVAPELLFDQGLGDIFVVRVAGNVVDPIALGSIEYAAEHLHAPLLVVLGHQSCGAVKAALESEGALEGNIGAILKKIKPAVEAAKSSGRKDGPELLDIAVQENVKNVYAEIMKDSPIVSEFVHEGKMEVVMGEYYLDSGEVRIIKGADKPHDEGKAAHEAGTEK